MPVIARSISSKELQAIMYTRRLRQARRKVVRILGQLRNGHYSTERGIRMLQSDMAYLIEYDEKYQRREKANE